METKSEHNKTPVYFWLLVIILMLIAIQVVMVTAYGIKHVKIKAGFYEPFPVFETTANDALRERLLWLENQLAPPPLLVWSTKPPPLLEFRELAEGEIDSDQSEPAADDSQIDSFDIIDTPSQIETPSQSASASAPSTDLTTSANVSGQVIEVTAFYVRQLPDLRTVKVDERKTIFISSVLPHILRANQELLERRRRIKVDYSNGSEDRIRKWAELYGIDGVNNLDVDQLFDELMLRVDAIPVPLALAQAIIESGWGTSRFARQGNALYGEWAWSESKGIKPLSPSNDRAVVRSFSSIFDSVRSYMHNLNTHDAYQNLRQKRRQHREGFPHILAQQLIPTLDKYAEDGDLYIRKLHNIVQTNNLYIYSNAVLAVAN